MSLSFSKGYWFCVILWWLWALGCLMTQGKYKLSCRKKPVSSGWGQQVSCTLDWCKACIILIYLNIYFFTCAFWGATNQIGVNRHFVAFSVLLPLACLELFEGNPLSSESSWPSSNKCNLCKWAFLQSKNFILPCLLKEKNRESSALPCVQGMLGINKSSAKRWTGTLK